MEIARGLRKPYKCDECDKKLKKAIWRNTILSIYQYLSYFLYLISHLPHCSHNWKSILVYLIETSKYTHTWGNLVLSVVIQKFCQRQPRAGQLAWLVNVASAFIFFCFLPPSYSFTVTSFLHDIRNVRTRYYQQFGIKHNQFQERRMVILLVWKQI